MTAAVLVGPILVILVIWFLWPIRTRIKHVRIPLVLDIETYPPPSSLDSNDLNTEDP